MNRNDGRQEIVKYFLIARHQRRILAQGFSVQLREFIITAP